MRHPGAGRRDVQRAGDVRHQPQGFPAVSDPVPAGHPAWRRRLDRGPGRICPAMSSPPRCALRTCGYSRRRRLGHGPRVHRREPAWRRTALLGRAGIPGTRSSPPVRAPRRRPSFGLGSRPARSAGPASSTTDHPRQRSTTSVRRRSVAGRRPSPVLPRVTFCERQRQEEWAASRRSASWAAPPDLWGPRRGAATPGGPRWYRAVASRGSRIADHAPVVHGRARSRPAPERAAAPRGKRRRTCTRCRPGPHDRCRTDASGSSGRGNGIRSMTTTAAPGRGHPRPATGTRCRQAARLVLGELPDELAGGVVTLADSGMLSVPRALAACSAARMDENS